MVLTMKPEPPLQGQELEEPPPLLEPQVLGQG